MFGHFPNPSAQVEVKEKGVDCSLEVRLRKIARSLPRKDNFWVREKRRVKYHAELGAQGLWKKKLLLQHLDFQENFIPVKIMTGFEVQPTLHLHNYKPSSRKVNLDTQGSLFYFGFCSVLNTVLLVFVAKGLKIFSWSSFLAHVQEGLLWMGRAKWSWALCYLRR